MHRRLRGGNFFSPEKAEALKTFIDCRRQCFAPIKSRAEPVDQRRSGPSRKSEQAYDVNSSRMAGIAERTCGEVVLAAQAGEGLGDRDRDRIVLSEPRA